MAKYVKLGPKAGGFADPYSLFKIARGQVKELKLLKEKRSGKIKNAIRGGHLVEVPEKEYKAYLASLEEPTKSNDGEPTYEEQLDDMKKKDLIEHYEETYDVTEEEVVAFSKLKHPEMVAELMGLKDD